jgi:putative cell wall-binding protein
MLTRLQARAVRTVRRHRFARVVTAVAVVVASLGLAVIGSAGSAAWASPPVPSPATIACATSTAFLSQGSPTQLYAEAFGSGTIAFNPVGTTTAGLSYNAIGVDPLNGYLYGIETNPTARDLLRINPTTGVVQDLGQVAPAPSGSLVAGAFDPAGHFYVSASNGTNLYNVDVVAGTSSVITLSASAGLADYTYVGGYLFGLNASAVPVRIDPTTGTVTTFTALPAVTTGTFGAAFTLGNGDADFGNNNGGVTEVQITNPGATTPTFTVVSTVTTATASTNDGAACVSAATHLSVATSGPATVAAGGTETWSLTVTDAGPGASSGFSISDVLPAGYTAVNLPTGCSASGSTVTCTNGSLAVNATATISISATAPGVAGCESNSVTVQGNEADSDPSNTDSISSPSICVTGNNAQTITFAQPGSVGLAAGTTTLVAKASSALAVAFNSSTLPVCTVSGTTVTLLASGTCTIEADQAGDATYLAATPVTRSFTVTAIPQAITFATPADISLAAGTDNLSATANSGLGVVFTSSTTPVCTVSGSTVTLVAVGTCTIAADQPGNSSYAAATTVTQSFAVTTIAQTITFTGPADTDVTAGPVAVSATADSNLPVVFTSATTTVCTVSGGTVTLLTVGVCTIDADQAGNASHAPAPTIVRSFNVTSSGGGSSSTPQTITFPGPPDTGASAATVSVTATADSGLPVTFASGTTSVCTVSGSTVTLLAAGVCTIDAGQAGDGTYAAASTVSQSFNVIATSQAITFAQPVSVDVSVSTVSLSGTAGSGLAISYTSQTTAVCTVSGSTVALLSAGTCTIDADQDGNGTYAAAPTVTQSFIVTTTINSSGNTNSTDPAPTTARVGGADRDATAADLAVTMYPTAGSAHAVVLARDDVYADGLTGSPLANAVDGPLLLTKTSTLSADTEAAIVHVLPVGGTVICLGGDNAISPEVLTELQSLGYQVLRIGGVDRYATAALIANKIGTEMLISQIYLATGENFADALPAADAAGLTRGVVLLTANTAMPGVTTTWIDAHSGLSTTAIGGSAATADSSATAIVGPDRYATAAQVATTVASAATGIVLATGVDFPDGLAGAAYAVHNGWSLLLLNPTALTLNTTQASYLHTAHSTVTTVTTIGGTAALPEAATDLVTVGLN